MCSVQPAGCPVQSLHGHTTDQLASAISKANRTSQQYRRSSQKPPAELYETFKSKFPGIAHNANVNTTTSANVVPGATALDVAPAVLPMYVVRTRLQSRRAITDDITDRLLQTHNR